MYRLTTLRLLLYHGYLIFVKLDQHIRHWTDCLDQMKIFFFVSFPNTFFKLIAQYAKVLAFF